MVADALRLLQFVLELESKTAIKASSQTEMNVPFYNVISPNYLIIFSRNHQSIPPVSVLGSPDEPSLKLFHELTGETWLSHTRRLAVEHAQQRLFHTELPITSIAFECGFRDLSTFYRQFKKLSGMSPGEYRATRS